MLHLVKLLESELLGVAMMMPPLPPSEEHLHIADDLEILALRGAFPYRFVSETLKAPHSSALDANLG